jgi:hypothetical protein
MPKAIETQELASRLRRDADATSNLEYASLMRRAAEELEAYCRLADPDFGNPERRAG